MLPPAALDAADRLVATLMTLLRAVTVAATSHRAPSLPGPAAQTLLARLSALVTTLIRIGTVGLRTPPEPGAPTPARRQPARRARHDPAPSLPRRFGWLLAALPDIAPAIAAHAEALLADPALAALLEAAPTLHRKLRPLLRGLGLTSPPSPGATPPCAPSPALPLPAPCEPAPPPRQATPRQATPRRRERPARRPDFRPRPHVLIVPLT